MEDRRRTDSDVFMCFAINVDSLASKLSSMWDAWRLEQHPHIVGNRARLGQLWDRQDGNPP